MRYSENGTYTAEGEPMNCEITPGIDYDPEITRLYNEGKERAEIAENMNLDVHYISRRLTKLRKWGRLTRESRKKTANLINSELRVYLYMGLSVRQIADRTGISYDDVKARVDSILKDEHKFNRSKCRRVA